MKTDREKLIELLHEDDEYACVYEHCFTTCNGCKYEFYIDNDRCWEARLADYLISKGVTIPVRCGECIYMEEAYEKNGFSICPASGMEIMNTDFCSYGERKEE